MYLFLDLFHTTKLHFLNIEELIIEIPAPPSPSNKILVLGFTLIFFFDKSVKSPSASTESAFISLSLLYRIFEGGSLKNFPTSSLNGWVIFKPCPPFLKKFSIKDNESFSTS